MSVFPNLISHSVIIVANGNQMALSEYHSITHPVMNSKDRTSRYKRKKRLPKYKRRGRRTIPLDTKKVYRVKEVLNDLEST